MSEGVGFFVLACSIAFLEIMDLPDFLNHEVLEWVSAVIFSLVALGHLGTVIAGWDVVLGPYDVPVVFRLLVFVLAGFLAAGFWNKLLR